MKQTLYLFTISLFSQANLFAQAPNISYPNPVQTYKIGEKISVLSPINTGGTMSYDTNTVFAGSGTGGTVFMPKISNPKGITVDVLGNVYITDTGNNLIRKISPTGDISPFAGSGIAGSTNGTGTAASFNGPNGIAVDASGNFYVTESYRVRKITPSGLVSTFAGSGTAGSTNGSGTAASFNYLSGIAVDVSGNVYVTESSNNKIRKITSTGVVSTFAGSGLQGSTDGTGTAASFNYPLGIAVDASGNIYVADRDNYKIRKITPAGVVSTFAGSGVKESIDGTGTAASFFSPNGVAVDTSGNIYITDNNGYYKIRMITSIGVVSSFYSGISNGYLPDGERVNAMPNGGVVVDATGTIYALDSQSSQIIKTTSSDEYYTSELPAGLYINRYTGDISGTPTKISPVTTYCVTAKKINYYGSTFCNVKIDVVSKPIISYDTPQYYDVGDIITSLSPTNAGSSVTGYTISPSLPIGLSFNTSSGVISGIPTVITSATTYTVTATNSYGSGNFNIVISTGSFKPIISYTSPETYTAGNAITPLWPINTGSPATSYSINPKLPIGLSFNTSQGVISGTPFTSSADTYTITAFNQYSSGSCSVSISTVTKKPSISYATPQTYTAGNSITPLLPTNTGSPATNYWITPGLPSGLSFNSSTGIISGTPNAISSATTYTITAANSYGNGSCNISISTVATKPLISYSTPQTYAVGNVITQLSPINTGTAATYSVSPNLLTGLSINASTGVISGTPTAVSQPTAYTVTATNVAGSDSFNIVINTVGVKPTISYTTSESYIINTAITPLTPTTTGSPVTSYVISPSLSTGLSFDSSTGTISGTPIVAIGEKTYTITANNSYGTGNTTVVINTVTAKPAISYTTPNTFGVGSTIILNPITNTGLPAIGYSISPQLSNGLSFNTSTGVISGTANTVTPTTGYTITATNTYGSTSFNIVISTAYTSPVISYTTPQNYSVGTAIKALTPVNTGSPATSWSIAPSLPSGISFNTSTGEISGTPTVIKSVTNYTITATNSYGSGNIVISIAVAGAKPTIIYITPQTYTVGTAITPLQPTNTGGTATSYAVAPILPMGLTLNTATGVISGAPAVASAQTSYTVSATNAYGTGTATVIITINTAGTKPAISYTTPQTYTVGTVITPLQPTNTGSPVTSYSISPNLPNGLVLNTTTGVISGTSTVATPAATYTVTGTNTGGSSSTIISITIDRVLPSNNFTIESKGETCTNSNNGEISITAKEIFPYVASINGKSYPFTNNSLKVASLTPGTYTVTITIPGENFEQSFTVVIAKGATITGKSSVVSNKVAVEIVEGTAPYTVFVNGVEQFETTSSSFSVDLKKGGLLEVKTAKACEGIYAKDIKGLEGAVSAYPNPTSGSFEIELPTLRKEVVIVLYTLDGHLISNKNYTIENGKVQLTLENQPTGTYIAKIELDAPDYLKIIKN
jgi:sugar lactone lactonase YvrE/predicted secreted Zn-dependent protease